MDRLLSLRLLLVTCFFLSGATSLIYQLLWTRRLSLTFGHTVLAVSTVVAITMAGLALGAWWGGSLADSRAERGIAFYAWLEAGIGLWALASLPLLQGLEVAYVSLAGTGMTGLTLYLCLLVGASLVLLPPTTAMGATLPLLGRALLRADSVHGILVAHLYGANTLGAFSGAALAGFVMLPRLGLWKSLVTAAVINLAIAAVAGWLSRQTSLRPREREASALTGRAPFRALIGFCLAGAAAMIYQVGWTRALILTIGSSTYAFAAVLALFLLGLAVGSLLFGALPRAWVEAIQVTQVGGLMLVGCLCAMVSIWLLGHLPFLFLLGFPWTNEEFSRVLALQMGLVALAIGPACLLLGLTFPAVNQAFAAVDDEFGRRLGELYTANTVGCIAGALVAGFGLIPLFGTQTCLQLGVVLGLVATGLFWPRRRLVLALIALVGVAFIPRWNPGAMAAGSGVYSDVRQNFTIAQLRQELTRRPAFYRDGLSTTVSIHIASQGNQTVRVNGKTDASLLQTDRQTMYLAGYLGPLLHPEPRTAAVIGLGSGMTLQALSHFASLERLDCVELEPAMVEANRHWTAYNGNVLADPRVKVHLTDGGTFFKAAHTAYDLIVSEPSNPWIAGVGNLYTVEFFETCRDRLSDDGLMVQWFHYYGVSPTEIGIVFNSFYEAFPHGSVWASSPGDLLLVGSKQSLEPDYEAFEQAYRASPSMQLRFYEIDLFTSQSLAGHRLFGRDRALSFAPASLRNTDDRPLLEFLAPLHLFDRGRTDSNLALLLDLQRPEVSKASADTVHAWINMGALEWARRWLAQHQGTGEALFIKARLLAGSRRGEPVQEAFQAALSQSPEERKGLVAAVWGEFETREGRLENAAKLIRLALDQNPEGVLTPPLQTRLGQILGQLGRPEEAIAVLEQVTSHPLVTHAAYVYLGSALAQLERFDEAEEILLKGRELNAYAYEIRAGLGFVALRKGDLEAAIVAYRGALELVPDSRESLVNLALCYSQLDRSQEALATLRRAVLYHPNDPLVRHNLNQLEK